MQSKLDFASLFAVAIVAFWISALGTGYGQTGGWIMGADGLPSHTDFSGFYAAGKVLGSDGPMAPYNWDLNKKVQLELTGFKDDHYFPWPYPPTFLFLAAFLSMFPFMPAMLGFALTTLAAVAAVLHRICVTPRQFIFMLATPAIWLNMFVGQNGSLAAALVGLGLLLLETHPIAAGIAFGMLTFKPHLGLLLPVALAAGGYWRCFLAAGATSLALVGVSALSFGADVWLAWPEQLLRIAGRIDAYWLSGKIQSVWAFLQAVGVPRPVANGVMLVILTGLIGLVGWVWRQPRFSFPLKAATLAACMAMASPYQFVYDLVILTVAQAFLMRHLSAEGGVRWTHVALLFAVNVLIFKFSSTHVPLGIVGAVIVLAMVARELLATPAGEAAPAVPGEPSLPPGALARAA